MDDFQSNENKLDLLKFYESKRQPLGNEDIILFEKYYHDTIIDYKDNKDISLIQLNETFLNKIMSESKKQSIIPQKKIPKKTVPANRTPNNPYFQPQMNENISSYQNISGNYNNNNQTIEDYGQSSMSSQSVFSKQFENPSEPIRTDFPDKSVFSNYLIINSRDRDILLYPNHEQFVVNLSKSLKNVYIVTLYSILIPNFPIFLHEPYIMLQIREFEDTFSGSNNSYSNIFSIIPPNAPKNCHQKFFLHFPIKTKKTYRFNPISNVSRLSIKLLDSQGASLQIPSDAFKILTIERCNDVYKIVLKYDNIYDFYQEWLTNAMRLYDQLQIHGISQLGSLFYLNILFQLDTIIVYACSSKRIVNIEECVFELYGNYENEKCVLSMNKISILLNLKIKCIEYDTKTIPTQIVV